MIGGGTHDAEQRDARPAVELVKNTHGGLPCGIVRRVFSWQAHAATKTQVGRPTTREVLAVGQDTAIS
jgi:hypothetical protein